MESVIAALTGLAVGIAGTYVKSLLAARAKVGEELRDLRLGPYRELWAMTALVSRWPTWPLTAAELDDLHWRLRAWYYGKGGLYLSENSRARYGEMQQVIGLTVAAAADAAITPAAYRDLVATCSALRTALTEDLESRRQRSVWWTVSRWRLHAAQAYRAALRIEALGGAPAVHVAPPGETGGVRDLWRCSRFRRERAARRRRHDDDAPGDRAAEAVAPGAAPALKT
jgi:hypothetical protein